jgi:hypothetical protein
MRKSRITVPVLCAMLLAAAGCADLERRPERAPQADAIPVYENVVQLNRPFSIIERIWTGKGISAFIVPTYDSIEHGLRDMQQQAVVHGGDAVMNFTCYRRNASIPMEERPPLHCNGAVIRYLPQVR